MANWFRLNNLKVTLATATGFVVGALIVSLFITPSPSTTDSFVPAVTVADPSLLIIPALDLTTTFSERLGVNEDGTVAVPESYDSVGWYQYGPKPGEIGPAVVLGHVDSKAGPGVFYDLKRIKRGDEILVQQEDGSVATFVVTTLQFRRQEKFPTEAVYGELDYAGLRLVTCTGIYDKGEKAYSHNLIVYATLVENT